MLRNPFWVFLTSPYFAKSLVDKNVSRVLRDSGNTDEDMREDEQKGEEEGRNWPHLSSSSIVLDGNSPGGAKDQRRKKKEENAWASRRAFQTSPPEIFLFSREEGRKEGGVFFVNSSTIPARGPAVEQWHTLLPFSPQLASSSSSSHIPRHGGAIIPRKRSSSLPCF